MTFKKDIKTQKDINPYLTELNRKQSEIRAFFKSPTSPFHYITYEEFINTFPLEQMNFKNQNLNIIDIHLRYRLYVREKMAPYKWIPILCLTPALFVHFGLILVIPAFTAYMFDHYFQRFFMWRHRQDRIINIRNQFATKLSKEKNKVRRVVLFQKLKENLKRSAEPQEGNAKLLVDGQNIKADEIFTLEDNVDHNIRRFGELWNYLVFGQLKISQFKLWEHFNFSKYTDIFDPIKYNIKDNKPDLLLYYSILAVPKLLNVIFKRR